MRAVKKLLSKAKEWILKNRSEAVFLAVILVIGAILRLYRIDEYMIFLADQGRDAVLVRRLLVNADPILVGPGTSVGNMYLGPIYYYMMAPALWLANFSPVGPSVMVALFGIATVFFVWYFARKLFGVWGAAVAAFFYAVSPTVVSLSIFSWNPNIMPFFSLFVIYSIWKFWIEEKLGWITAAGVLMAIVLQSHYMGFLLFPVFIVFWILTLLKVRSSEKRGELIRYSLGGLFFFLLLMSPLVIFDARHGWRNFSAMEEFLTVGSGLSLSLTAIIKKIPSVVLEITSKLLGKRDPLFGKIIGLVMIVPLGLVIYLWKKMASIQKKGLTLIFVWLGVGILGLTFYQGALYDHYYGFLFPAPFLLIAAFVFLAIGKGKLWGKTVVVLLSLILASVSLSGSHQLKEPNRLLARTIKVSDKIIEESEGEAFNLSIIADRNSEGAYQYFLEKEDAPLTIIDPQIVDETVTEQLFVVCEKPEAACDPTHSPKAEIANYGWSKIAQMWEIEGIVLYKLVHAI